MATMFKVAALKPASDADKPIRATLPEDMQHATIDAIARHVLFDRNIPLSDRDLTTRLQGEMKGDHGFTLNGRAVTGNYQIKPEDYTMKLAPDNKTQYGELTLVIAGIQTQGYQ